MLTGLNGGGGVIKQKAGLKGMSLKVESYEMWHEENHHVYDLTPYRGVILKDLKLWKG